jgi:organic hydroperoxide reductase OsmC/OhrA
VHTYRAKVSWTRDESARFTDQRYSRRHQWSFDGGVTVPASASPQVVPVPMSAADAVDPEEALVASASSCHMLWFLFLAAKRGFVIDEYVDEALGTMGKDSSGRTAMTRIALRPRIMFSGDRRPTEAELRELHEQAHGECFIANSLKTEVVVEAHELA